jgi:hypothetical protein
MEFKGLESVVIDVLRTPEIQRLRRIKQLGLAYLVFPGAEHSRLVHSLGAAHLALRFGHHLALSSRDVLVIALRPGTDAIRDLAVAALCHDLGHGPLSHAWEHEVVGKDYNAKRWISALGLQDEEETLKGLKWHELVGQAFLAWEEGHLHQLLEKHEAGFSKRLRYLLRGEYYLPYLPRLLSSDVDVDRADFLLRDAFQCGVAYGRYDLDRLISTCAVGKTDSNKLVVGFQVRKALRVIEQFLIARRALYDTVYYHKTVHCAEGMAGLFLRRLKEVLTEDNKKIEVAEFVRPLVKIISGEVLEPRELLSLDDFSLMVLIDNVSNIRDMDITVHDLAQRILSRDLFKLVPCPTDRINDFVRKERSYSKIYDAIQPFCPGKAEFYLVAESTTFSMFSESDKNIGYFIDEKHRATPMHNHLSFRNYWQKPEDTMRLFTIREAVEAVQKLICP